MDKHLTELYDLCEVVNRAIKDANEKIRNAGGKLTAGDVDYVDKLTHTLKSIKTTIAMIEHEDEYSEGRGYTYDSMSYARGTNRSMPNRMYPGGSSYDDMSYNDGNSYARGRGRNAKRDSMGRYSSERGYSRDDAKKDMMSDLREIMQDAPDEQTRQEFQRFMNKLETM